MDQKVEARNLHPGEDQIGRLSPRAFGVLDPRRHFPRRTGDSCGGLLGKQSAVGPGYLTLI
jgi:hypothetical protein